ncbi:unnamed protein product, partial [Didymodactylos carnosus]
AGINKTIYLLNFVYYFVLLIWYKEFGDQYVGLWGPVVRLILFNPNYIQDVLKTKYMYYSKTSLLTGLLSPIIGTENLLLSNVSTHSRARKMINPAFHSSNLISMIDIMTEETSKLLNEWIEKINNSNNKIILEMNREFSGLTLDIISNCAFGTGIINEYEAKEVIYDTFSVIIDMFINRLMNLVGVLPIIKYLPLRSKQIMA